VRWSFAQRRVGAVPRRDIVREGRKLLIILAWACPDRLSPSFAKVFWFFFSKKNCFLPLSLHWRFNVPPTWAVTFLQKKQACLLLAMPLESERKVGECPRAPGQKGGP
jgi:hypothetical protein